LKNSKDCPRQRILLVRFSKKEQDLRVAEKMEDIFFVEVNLSANHIRNNIKQLLEYFSLNPANMKIYLREDRDV